MITLQDIKNNEEVVEYDPSKDGKILSEDQVVDEGDLEGYSEETDDDVLLDGEDDAIDDGKDDLFEELDDEGEEMLFGNDLANDNLDNDDDIIE